MGDLRTQRRPEPGMKLFETAYGSKYDPHVVAGGNDA
jgi:hypothetical protein